MSKFKELNEEIVIEYLQLIEEIYPELLKLIYPITIMGMDYVSVFSELLSDDLETFDYDSIEIYKTIDLVREFLSSIDDKYVHKFDKSMSNGTIDIFNNKDVDLNRFDEPYCIEYMDNISVNLPINNSINDGGVIVHEFFHLTNSDYENGTRDIVTEIISCYMELRYYQFLISKGYDEINLYKAVYERINNTYNSAANLVLSASILDIYYNTGDISKKNIKFMNKYRKIYSDNKNQLLKLSNDDNFEDIIYSFHYDVAHLLGGIISINLLGETNVNDIKIDYINNNMEDLSIKKILDILDFDINNFTKGIDKCSEIIKMLEGVIYEDNSYSGSDGSREDKVKYRTC